MNNDNDNDNNRHDEHFRAFDEIRQQHIDEMRLVDEQQPEQQQQQEEEARRPVRRQRRWWGRRLPRPIPRFADNDQPPPPPVARMIPIPRRAETNHNYNNEMIVDLVEQDVIEREPAQPPPPPPLVFNQFPNQPEVAGRYAAVGPGVEQDAIEREPAQPPPPPPLVFNQFPNQPEVAGRYAAKLLDDVLPPRRVRIRGGERVVAALGVALAADDNNNNNNNDDDDDNNNVPARARAEVINLADDDDDIHDDLMMMDFVGDVVGGGPRRHIFGRRIAALRARDNTPPLLFDMVKEGRMCTSVLSGWGRSEQGCNSIVEHCEANTDQANYLSELGRTPIHEACLRGACRHVIQALIAANNHGAMVRDHHGNNPLHLLFVDYSSSTSSTSSSALSNTTSTNIVWSPKDLDDMVGDLLEVNPTAMGSSVNAYGDTPLHAACMFSETMVDPNSIVQLLTANTASASIMNRKNQTPLRLHCERRNASAEVARLLLDANPDALTVLDNESGWAPIHYAASNANFELLRVLVEACPEAVQVRTAQRQTALHLLCQQHTHLSSSHNNRRAIVNNMSSRGGFSEVAAAVGLLLKADPDAIMHQDANNSFTPLHLVCKTEGPRQVPVQVVQLLLRCNPRAAAVPDSEQYLPLHHACEMGSSLEVIQALIEAGILPDTNNQIPPIQSTATSRLFDHSQRENYNKKIATSNKMGNTPLHDACFRSTPFEQLEVIAKKNPKYILVRNNAGYTPLQILCKNGRIEERIISTFAQMGGPGIFSVTDSNGNTPLHSAMRPDINISSLKCLIRASPDAIRSKTMDGDSPLHLACLRKCSEEVIREVAMAASNGDTSPALESNLAAQTPIGIAMAEFRGLCQDGGTHCCLSSSYRPIQSRVFQVLATLVKILFYGPVRCQHQGLNGLSLLRASVILHRQNIRLDPAFIRHAIHLYPEEVKIMDEDGNYPLHIEASIPVEKMSLLDGVCNGSSHKRMTILRILLDAYPHACAARNREGQFPLGLMIMGGRLWGHSIAVALRAFPPALHWYKGLDDRFSSILLEKASKECGADTLFQLLLSRPGLFDDTGHS
ncbi:ankyrin [Fragilariopsis cylindrus CCMP1102]|uniref:Ankyrin n=1 Tax=Fragilariopsis cylindrus CCMP1102 TaxID=635003 RepID=A0A1E7FU47_9STRA|nr:ankyrin [Fragilariopsis cylindrus CCMP1102]|eukprot:OEU21681.1 ankyrin [Fragilariopsis cylindrus CCMP1102]